MPRPKKTRYVSGSPDINAFMPVGISPTGEVVLSVEGLEAIRLSDFEGLDQETAATMMEVSRQTYGRILSEARRTIAKAFVLGKTVRIGGGSYELRGRRRRRRGRGLI